MKRHALTSILTLAACTCACDERIVDVVVPVDAAPPTFPRSCEQIYAPGAPDGFYWLDPDGAGPVPATQYFCDMANGGWTRLVRETFDAPSPAFTLTQPFMPNAPVSTSVGISSCGAFGAILGGHRLLGFNDEVALAMPLSGVPHTRLRVAYDLVVLDSWDGERAYLKVDGQEVWSTFCSWGDATTCNQSADECGWMGEGRSDGIIPVDVTVAHDAAATVITFGAVLDQSRGDESWGIDNLVLLVK